MFIINIDQEENRISFLYRCGAEEARGAHNSEVIRSKRISGNGPTVP